MASSLARAHPQNLCPISLQLFDPNACHTFEVTQSLRVALCNGAQCGVVENHERGQVVLPGNVSAPDFESGQPL